MLEVIVTNEFTPLNAASAERRPFKVLTPRERSSAIVIARYSSRPRPQTTAQDPPPDLFWKAFRLGTLCAACVFAFFSLSQRNWFQRSGGIVSPLPKSIQRLPLASPAPTAAALPVLPAESKTVSPTAALAPQTFVLPDSTKLNVTEFNLSVTPEFQNVGRVHLRLTGVNPAANTYDIKVMTSQREFYRQDVKLSEHLLLARDDSAGPELVVGAISENRVFGYLSEPRHRLHHRHRRRQ